jgi:hypothetical protein
MSATPAGCTCNNCDLPSVNGADCLWSQGFIQCP